MEAIKKLLSMLGRNDEKTNQELARHLAVHKDSEGIQEIIDNLWNTNQAIQNDCIKVIDEIGYIEPTLISKHVGIIINLLKSENNRMVCGAMIALSTIAELKPEEIFENLNLLIEAIENGNVITVEAGIKTLAIVAAYSDEYNRRIFPFLIEKLNSCPPNQLPIYTEFISRAVNLSNKSEFLHIINHRKTILSESQQKRLEKLLKKI